MLKTTKRRQYVIVTLQVMEVLMHSLEALHCNNCEIKVPFMMGEAGSRDSGFELFKLHVFSWSYPNLQLSQTNLSHT